MEDVVVGRKQHQHQHQSQPDSETELLRPLRQRLPADRLHGIEQKVSAIEKRHRKQVEQSNRHRQYRSEVNQCRKADGGDLAGDLGNASRRPIPSRLKQLFFISLKLEK